MWTGKPSNVLLGDDGRMILTDFGIATSPSDATLTTAGLVVGSPTYMSPERRRGEGIGPAADMWSLGATLYAALEGQPPFQATSALGTITAVLVDDLRPPFSKGPLQEALVGMLAKDPSHRLTHAQASPLLQRATGAGVSDHHTVAKMLSASPIPVPAVAERHDDAGEPGSRDRSSVLSLAMGAASRGPRRSRRRCRMAAADSADPAW